VGDSSYSFAALGLLPFCFFALLALSRFGRGIDRAGAVLEGLVGWVLVSYLSAELFSYLNQLAFWPILIFWLFPILSVLCFVRIKFFSAFCNWGKFVPAAWVVCLFVIATLFLAITAAPNTFDGQTYHLPRIEHWIQNGSLTFYPTSIPRQNDYGPVAEVLLLHTRLLTGSDTFYPLIQWLSMATSIAGVFRITRQLGGTNTQCWLAAVFLVTLPVGVLESSSVQNDHVVAALLIAFVSLGLDAITFTPPLSLLAMAVAAVGLSGLVKPIGYVLGVGFALWFALSLSRRVSFKKWVERAVTVLATLLIITVPFGYRYIAAHGGLQSDMGQHALNGSFGVAQTVDNFLRDAMLNFNTGVASIDTVTNRQLEKFTAFIGVDWEDTTEKGQPFSSPPRGLYIFHEDNAPNPIHAGLVALSFFVLFVRWHQVSTKVRLYWAAWIIGVVVFAATIRWNPWQTRYHLPGFALIVPGVATVWPARWFEYRSATAIAVALSVVGLPSLLFNRTRQLVPVKVGWPPDQVSYLTQSPEERLFASQPKLLGPFREAADAIVHSKASEVGLLIGSDSWEYPLWSLLRVRMTGPFRIEHVTTAADLAYPRGPFEPEVLFWNHGEAPPTVSFQNREFERVTSAGTVAIFVPRNR